MTIPGYVPAIGERDLDKIIRGVRNLYENGPLTRLTADTNFYIDNSSGNDGYDGLTSSRPWKTGNFALQFLQKNVNFNGFVPTLNYLNGAQQPIAHSGGFFGGDSLIIQCSSGTATFDGAGPAAMSFVSTGPTEIGIQVNISISNSGDGNGIESILGSNVRLIGGLTFNDVSGAVGSGIYASRGGYVIVEGLILIDGDMPYFSQSSHNGMIRYDGCTLRYLANCTFSGANIFSEGEGGETVFTSGAAFDTATHGATVTGKRYWVYNAANIQFAGGSETSIPGTVAGTSHTGGVYYIDIDSPVGVSGLRFPATQAASSDANVLDDYEEGTWTPVLEGATTAGTQTYGTQVGAYTKIGNLVFATGNIVLTAKDGTTAGNMRISGLPFTAKNTTGLQQAIAIGPYDNWDLNVAGGYYQFTGSVTLNTTTFALVECGDNVARVSFQAAAFGNTSAVRFSAEYVT